MILEEISLGKTMIDACGEKLFGGRSGKAISVFHPLSWSIWPATFRSDDLRPRSRRHFFEPSHQVDSFANSILSNNQHRELCFTDSLERSQVSRFPAQTTSCYPAKPLHASPATWPSLGVIGRFIYSVSCRRLCRHAQIVRPPIYVYLRSIAAERFTQESRQNCERL